MKAKWRRENDSKAVNLALALATGNFHGERLLHAFENLIDLLRGQVFIIIIVHLHHRRSATRRQALYFRERKAPVRRCLATFDAELFLEKLGDFLGAAQRA